MGIVDIVILVIALISVIYGIYRGFLGTLLSGGCFILAVICAFSFGPTLSAALRGNPGVKELLVTYTDAVARVGDQTLANTEVAFLSEEQIGAIIGDTGLPGVIGNILEECLKNKTFVSSGITTVKQYVSDTLVGITVNVISYVLCFLLACIAFSILGSVIRHVADLPVLRQLDGLAGGVLGLIRAVLILYVLFLLVPVMDTLLPVEGLNDLISESRLAPFFTSSGFFTRVAAWIF